MGPPLTFADLSCFIPQMISIYHLNLSAAEGWYASRREEGTPARMLAHLLSGSWVFLKAECTWTLEMIGKENENTTEKPKHCGIWGMDMSCWFQGILMAILPDWKQSWTHKSLIQTGVTPIKRICLPGQWSPPEGRFGLVWPLYNASYRGCMRTTVS